MTTKDKETSAESQEKKVLSFRAPKIVQKQLAELASLWGESLTHVIHRAIALAYERESNKNKK